MENEQEHNMNLRNLLLWGLPILLLLFTLLSIYYADRPAQGWVNPIESIDVLPIEYSHPRAIDLSGSIWFSSRHGISVFDGEDWTIYTEENSGLASNVVTEISIDHAGLIWIGTGQGLNTFDGEVWKTFTIDNSGVYSNEIKEIEFDQDGNIWIVTRDGLYTFDGVDWGTTSMARSGIYDKNIVDLLFDERGYLWIRDGNGVSYFDGNNWIPVNMANSGIHSNRPMVMEIDLSGNIWFGCVNGISVYDGELWKKYDEDNSGLLDNHITSLAFAPSGIVWIGTLYGPSVIDPNNVSNSTASILSIRGYFFSPQSIWFTVISIFITWLSVLKTNKYALVGPAGWIFTWLIGPPYWGDLRIQFIFVTTLLGSIGALMGGKSSGQIDSKDEKSRRGMLLGLGSGVIIAGIMFLGQVLDRLR